VEIDGDQLIFLGHNSENPQSRPEYQLAPRQDKRQTDRQTEREREREKERKREREKERKKDSQAI